MASPLEELIITDTIPLRPEVQAAPRSRCCRWRGCSAKRSSASTTAIRSARCSSSRRPDRTGEGKGQVMDFSKVNVEVRKQSGKGGARKVRAAGKVPGVLYGNKARADRRHSRREDAAAIARQGAAPQHRFLADRRRRRQERAGDRDGPRRADRSAVAASSCTSTSCASIRAGGHTSPSRSILTGKPIGAINGGNLHQSMHAILIAREAGGDPDQARGRRHRRSTSATCSTSATSSWRRACARCSTQGSDRVGRRAEGREGRGRGAPVEGAVPAEGAAAAAGASRCGRQGAAPRARLRRPAAAAAAKKEGEKKGK